MNAFDSGIGRLNYFLAKVVMAAVMIFAVIYVGPESSVLRFLSLALMIAGVFLDVMRLRSTGISQWFVFMRFLPYGAPLLWIFLQSAQPDWVETKRFDRTGWTILGVHALLVALFIYLMFRSPGMEIFSFSFA